MIQVALGVTTTCDTDSHGPSGTLWVTAPAASIFSSEDTAGVWVRSVVTAMIEAPSGLAAALVVAAMSGRRPTVSGTGLVGGIVVVVVGSPVIWTSATSRAAGLGATRHIRLPTAPLPPGETRT